jgi:hypothetical protein
MFNFRRIAPLIVLLLTSTGLICGKDFTVTGTVTDPAGMTIPNAKVSMFNGAIQYSGTSGSDGKYSLRISGVYNDQSDQLSIGMPHPNPFTFAVNVPFSINTNGDVRFTVYTFNGQMIKDMTFKDVSTGSYRIVWDGCNDNGSPVRQGLYIYALTFKGSVYSAKFIKSVGYSAFSSATTLEAITLPPVVPPAGNGTIHLPVITKVDCQAYYPVRLTDIVIRQDTVIDFVIARIEEVPFKTTADHIEMFTESGYRPLILKGINLGSSPPGTFPGEIGYAITADIYEDWIKKIGEAGFNSIRIYTLHPPVFYEKLANYNNRHPADPILLFQGIWLDEVDVPSDPQQWNLILREPAFKNGIHEITDCVHGNKSIALRPGRAYGDYKTDISRWIAGFIIGREISPQEITVTNTNNSSITDYSGTQFSITGGSAADVFATRMLDETASYEHQKYFMVRPVSMSSWPTLDPLTHPSETHTDEDKEMIDIEKISRENSQAGLFATYHAYPYYPNFISDQPSYRVFSDGDGPDSYLGYLYDLKNHYSGVPLVIGEFGVPSSWGSAHQSYSNMNHGGYSEIQQGQKDMRLMHNIIDAGCAGGFMFAWMDEWFKPTWIVQYLEAYGFNSDGTTIPTRQLWHNLCSPEQNFGLIRFDQTNTLPFVGYSLDKTDGPVTKVEATNDNRYFFLNVETSDVLSEGDTVMVAFDTYLSSLGESKLPNGKVLSHRSEFMCQAVIGSDTALHFVTQAYDMNGLTPRFNLSDPLIQKYRSTVTDGAPWEVMQWTNDEYAKTTQDIGRMPMEHASDFTEGQRTAVAWNGNHIRLRIPWTMLYYYDPTRMAVIDGAVSGDGGYTFTIQNSQSDGIAISVYCKGSLVSTTDRYNWDSWLIVPPTVPVPKASLGIISEGLKQIPGFAD